MLRWGANGKIKEKRYHLANTVSYFQIIPWNKFLPEGNFQNDSIPCLWGRATNPFQNGYLFSPIIFQKLGSVNISFFRMLYYIWTWVFSGEA